MISLPIADVAAVSDLLDVFQTYGGGMIFQGLTGSAGLLGQIGWIFTAFGAFFILWGFVLRSRGAGGEEKLGEIVRTWIVIGFMLGGPVLMRAAMEAADGIYSSSVGGPGNLANACVKAAYAMPELNSLSDPVWNNALAGSTAAEAGQGAATAGEPGDGSVGGYLKAYVSTLAKRAVGFAGQVTGTLTGVARILSLFAGFSAAMWKCLIVQLTMLPLYFLFLASAGLLWFMDQLRYFLAVVGTMMLPFFVGMFSLPAGHPNRPAAQAYVMHLVSLALWPVSWAIGHVGTIVLYDALISLIAGTSRVPAIAALLQWSAIKASGSSVSEEQLRAAEAALGNLYMGNIASMLAILVGGIGFAVWVFAVCVFGPVFLHKMLTTGALFMNEAFSATGRQALSAGSMAAGAAAKFGSGGARAPDADPAGAFSRSPARGMGLPPDLGLSPPGAASTRTSMADAAARVPG